MIFYLKNSAIEFTTNDCASLEIAGQMGSARVSRAARSASGKSPRWEACLPQSGRMPDFRIQPFVDRTFCLR